MKGLAWTLGTTLLGLLQLGFIYLGGFIQQYNDIDWGRFIADGVYLFFSVAVVGGIALDHLVENWERENIKGKENVFCYVPSGVIILISMFLYVKISSSRETPMNFNNVFLVEMSIFLASLIYIFGMKSYRYIKMKE
ncbi:MAG: hypothetical protein WDA22_15180 [Bacteroidota bacterium]